MEDQKPVFNLASPIAQGTEMAKSEMKRERKKDDGKKRKKAFFPPLLPKHLKRYAYNPEDQF